MDLSVQQVTKRFKDFTAVDKVSFEIPKGSFFSILGPSGCGKTTLLRMIAGFLDPDEGEIIIRGKNVNGIPPNKRPVNLVFQHLALFPMMNVNENIAFGLRRKKVPKNEIMTKVRQSLEKVGLADYGNQEISQLSGGQRQRVAIARSLVLDPTVLLLDEPLGALDLKLRDQMKVELKKLQAEVGTTFVYITHDQSEALVMSDRVAVMNRGKFEQIDSPSNLYNKPETAFVARFVGENNAWSGRITNKDGEFGELKTDSGQQFRSRLTQEISVETPVNLYIRPEAMLINPDVSKSHLNRFQVVVKSTLFDGAASRLLVKPTDSDQELMVALPQNHEFDTIQSGDQIEIGWHENAGICFPGVTE